jgi:hypothetical protein
MVNNMLTNNNIKQLKRKLSLISLGNTIVPSVNLNKGYNIPKRTMFTLSNQIKKSKTIICKPILLTITKRNMWKATGNTVSTRFLASIENPLVRKKILYTISYLLQTTEFQVILI